MANTHRRRTIRVNDTPDAADARTMRAREKVSQERSDELGRMARALAKGRKTADGWANILTGLGDPRRDKRMSSGVFVDRMTYDELAALYRSDDMIAKICDRPAEEMVRKGWRIRLENSVEPEGQNTRGVQVDEEAGDSVMAKLDDLDTKTTFFDALRFSAAYGGAGVFLGAVDKAKDASEPLNEDALEDIKFLTVLDARELYPYTYYADPLSPNFGLPELYRIRPAFTATMVSPDRQKALEAQKLLPIVHESRILRFPGVKVNRWQMRETLGWGDSKIQRIYDVCRDFGMSWHSAAYLITDFSQAVATMKGISEAIENGDDKSVQARLLAIEMMRSVARMVVMDEGETFERKQTPLSGLDAMLQLFFVRLAAAAEIPVTLLAGQAPAGLNATGDGDIRGWYDRVSSMQEWRLTPPLRRLVKLICKAKKGPTKGKVPEDIHIEYNPLWQLTAKEEAERRKLVAEADHIYITDQVVDPAEVGIARFGGARYSSDLTIDVEARRAFLEENPPGTDRQLGLEGAAPGVERQKQGLEGAGPGAGEGGTGDDEESKTRGTTGPENGGTMIAGQANPDGSTGGGRGAGGGR